MARVKRVKRTIYGFGLKEYILKMLLLARSQNAFALTEAQHAEIIKRAKKDYAAAKKAAIQ